MGLLHALDQKTPDVKTNSTFSCQLSIYPSHPPKYGCCAKLFSFFSNSKPFTPAAGVAAPFGVGVVEGLLALGLLTNSTVTGPSLQRFTFRDGAWYPSKHLNGFMYVNTCISKSIKHTHRYIPPSPYGGAGAYALIWWKVYIDLDTDVDTRHGDGYTVVVDSRHR